MRALYIFTGDMQFAEENTLFDAGVVFSCDVLKVPNHGNQDASSDKFMNAAAPRFLLSLRELGISQRPLHTVFATPSPLTAMFT